MIQGRQPRKVTCYPSLGGMGQASTFSVIYLTTKYVVMVTGEGKGQYVETSSKGEAQQKMKEVERWKSEVRWHTVRAFRKHNLDNIQLSAHHTI